jgi:hypothetical protein
MRNNTTVFLQYQPSIAQQPMLRVVDEKLMPTFMSQNNLLRKHHAQDYYHP